MKKKFLIVSLVALMLVVLAAACSGKQSKNVPTASKPSESQDSKLDVTDTKRSESKNEEKKPSTVQAIATFEGRDREKILIEGAKNEKVLNVYTSRTVEDFKQITEGYEIKYGIKFNVWRSGTDVVLQRALTEAKAGRFNVDIIDIAGPELEALYREKFLQEVKSPYLKDLIPEALRTHKEWVATSLNLYVHSYNTDLIKKDDIPKTYQDLLDPKWKGKLGIEAKDYDYFMVLVKEMGEEKGLKFWRDLVSTNGLDVRKGHTLITNMVRSGEIPFALTTFNFTTDQYKKSGSPLDWYVMDPVVARPNGVGLSKNAPHPNAAVLFYDYMISDAQKVMAELSFVPVNKNVDSMYKNMKFKLADPAVLLDEREKWENLYEKIIIRKEVK